ncbi:hypothetical protein F5B18DRAFT_126476 [Nemania serpens]|nr:hypothetical protein F5B18DRAFT_126476 [Nemania serpens]
MFNSRLPVSCFAVGRVCCLLLLFREINACMPRNLLIRRGEALGFVFLVSIDCADATSSFYCSLLLQLPGLGAVYLSI